MHNSLLIVFLIVFYFLPVTAQDCVGGQIYTNDAFLYGKFEVAMRSAAGNGIVSSFFLYNVDVGCNWPAENNEIDIEMTGNSQNLWFTTHYQWLASLGDIYNPDFNPHAGIQTYAFEWEPGIVRWFVNGQLAVVQDQTIVSQLIHPMRIMMNLWASASPGWVGPWNPAIMPVDSEYDFVRYYEYTPGSGNTGTNSNFTLAWEDQFDEFDDSRWTISQDDGFSGNLCRFRATSVEFENGKLFLQLEEEQPNQPLIPVTFSVNTNGQNLSPTDIIYLNGTFNNWCGTCAPMSESGGIWTRTEYLEAGKYEYLFTKNFWEENGGAPQGSSCDFVPCDEWTNYGIVVNYGSDPIVLDTPCWGECESCMTTSLEDPEPATDRKLLKLCDLLGREAEYAPGKVLIYYYDDGSVEQRVSFE